MAKQRPLIKSRKELVKVIAQDLSIDRAGAAALSKAFTHLIALDRKATKKALRSPITMLRKESLSKVGLRR